MNACLTVLAKAPLPGLAKTRLIPALGAEGAAALAERLLAHTLQEARSAGFGRLRLLGSPDAAHPALATHAGHAELGAQQGADLGERMHLALSEGLRLHALALLIGTDAPALDADRLREAARTLQDVDAVFVPALDGGYALVGLRGRPQPALFEAMRWSTPQVMADTRERLRGLGLRWTELAPVADVDEPADLASLGPEWFA
ncbi:TIGR04282 family arsenosugar biosynthesis glycosyltransferase [Inhella sp.]|uniref:TIGR04282 family arsenosugar biosynthesis glycosyltransferase n=1 Tax=Inhella sp. TaxID=1921806 RepID=UPI0035AE22C7